jgi:hypothetical protein
MTARSLDQFERKSRLRTQPAVGQDWTALKKGAPNMKKATWLVGLMALTAFNAVLAAEQAPESWDGLVEVKSKRMDAAFLMPGADFRSYSKVMIDPTQVAFQKDWMKTINQQHRSVSGRVTDADAAKILEAARTNFDDVFAEGFTKAGYEVVKTPGPDVLRVSTAVVNLYVNAPDTMQAGRSRSYTTEAGEATLILEARDSVTGALLGRVLDRRETQQSGTLQMSNSVTNLADFRSLCRTWASISAKGLTTLKQLSPIPTTLTPKQKLD